MGHRILLADDSLTIQKVVELTFSETDYELMAVGSGDRAVEALEEFRPVIVLADVVMPGLTGYEVCEAVKNGCHNEAWWIESASVEQFLKAQELGLIPKEPMTQ